MQFQIPLPSTKDNQTKKGDLMLWTNGYLTGPSSTRRQHPLSKINPLLDQLQGPACLHPSTVRKTQDQLRFIEAPT